MRNYLVTAFLVLSLVACGTSTPTSTPAPTLTSTPTSTSTPEPTPTSTFTPAPTSTFTPTFSPTPNLTPTATLEPIEGMVSFVPDGAAARLGNGVIYASAVAPDSNWLAIGTSIGIFVYDLTRHELIWAKPTVGAVLSMAWSPDSSQVVSGESGGMVTLWDAANGDILASDQTDMDNIVGAAWSPNKPVIALHDYNKLVLWGVSSHTAETTIDLVWTQEEQYDHYLDYKRYPASIYAPIAYSPDGNWLAVQTAFGELTIFKVDGTTLEENFTLPNIGHIAFDPKSQTLAKIDRSTGHARLRFIDLASGSEQSYIPLEDWDTFVNVIAYSPDGSRIAIAFHNEITYWDLENNKLTEHFGEYDYYLNALQWDADGKTLWAIDNYGASGVQWYVYDYGAFEIGTLTLRSFDGYPVSTGWPSLEWSKDGSMLAVGLHNREAVVWDVEEEKSILTVQEPQTLVAHTRSIEAITFSFDNQFLITGSGGMGPQTAVWDLETGDQIHLFRTIAGEKFVWVPDGSGLLQCYRDWLAIWDPVIAEQTFMGNPGLERVGYCDISPDGTQLAMAESDSIVHIWDFPEKRFIQTMTAEDDPEGYDFVGDFVWFPNGHIGAVSEADNFAVIWNADTGEVVNVLHDIPDNRSAAWSPDGSLLAIVPGFPPEPPYEIQVWDVESGTIVKQWNVRDYPEAIAWSPDSTLLASFATADGSVILWDMSDLLVSSW